MKSQAARSEGVPNTAPSGGFRAPIASKLAELRKAIAKIEASPRKGFTKAQRQAVYEAQDGQCDGCEASLEAGFEIDHAVTIWDGGAHDPSNWVGLCVDCHKVKTARDAANRAHTKRILQREEEGLAPSRLRSRGFDKRLTKGFDGKVRVRTSPADHRLDDGEGTGSLTTKSSA